jgi:hypothetical protein
MTSTPDVVIPDVLVMAAVERAERHRQLPVNVPGAPIWQVLEHLEVARRGRAARHVRALLAALEEAGSLERSYRRGVVVWSSTSAGRRRLARARRAGDIPELGESPQHRHWRVSRERGAGAIEGLREQLRAVLEDAAGLHAVERPPSDAWFELGDRLGRLPEQLGSASYCAHEWQEPDDALADRDDASSPGDERLDPERVKRLRVLRRYRRNLRLWQDSDG